MKPEIQLFQGHPVRTVELDRKRRASAIDCCLALGYENPRKAWQNLKSRHTELSDLSIILKVRTTDGKEYETDTLDLEGTINLCMLSRTEKATQFRVWARRILANEIQRKSALSTSAKHLSEQVQKENSKEVAKQLWTETDGSLNDLKEYYRESIRIETGKSTREIKAIGKELGLKSKDTASARQVLRKTAPEKACSLSLMDELFINGVPLETMEKAELPKHSDPFYKFLLGMGVTPMELNAEPIQGLT